MGWQINDRLDPVYVDDPREACWFGDGYEGEDDREFDWFLLCDEEGTESVLCHVECGTKDDRMERAGMTITFYVGEDYPERRDSRVRVLDYDEVTATSRVEFPDGYRAVVARVDLVTREA